MLRSTSVWPTFTEVLRILAIGSLSSLFSIAEEDKPIARFTIDVREAGRVLELPNTENVTLEVEDENFIHIAYAACGTSSKPALLHSIVSLYTSVLVAPAVLYYHFHVISDGAIFYEDLSFLKPTALFRVSIHTRLQRGDLFRQCSTQRLYIHEHPGFSSLKQLIYIDTDTIFLNHAQALWSQLDEMNRERQLFGIAHESKVAGGWYLGEAGKNTPHRDYGLNAGVLLLNLKELRNSNFSDERDSIICDYGPDGKNVLVLGDQDVLNIYHTLQPEKIHILSCHYNYRHRGHNCGDAGFPIVFHGAGAAKDSPNEFQHLYNFFGAFL